MQCQSCNHQNREDARFCSACGAPLLIKCAECGGDNAPGSRFCDNCGATLGSSNPSRVAAAYTPPHLANEILTSRSALEGELKQVTVLFCDIANSTELAHRVGAETMHELLNEFFELAAAEIHEVQGTINQFLGDGFMALFGAPIAHEDHVRRALSAALGIREKLGEIERDKTTALGRVQVRMGVNTGPVVVGKIGDNLRMDYTAVGDTTNLAARLQGLAEPGRIYLGESVRAIANGYFELTARGRHTLKGIDQPVPVYELVRAQARLEAEPQSRSLGIGSPLVGRERELSLLEVDLEGLRRGEGGIVVLTGEPGAGKSRLRAEIRRRLVPDDVLWLEGHSVSFGRNLSYWPFIEVIKSAFGINEDDAEDESLRKLERALQPLFASRTQEVLPYLATVLSVRLPAEAEERVKYLDGPAMRRQVFLCMRQLFEQLAERQPVVLMLEDWHWADRSSVDLAEHLLPLTRTSPLLVLFATRPDPEGNRARVVEFASQHPAIRFQEVVLSPLSEQYSAQLLANLVGNFDLPADLRAQILQKTEGNPFYLEEVVRSLVTDGVLVPGTRDRQWQLTQHVDQMNIPGTIQALLLARIDRLEEEVKQVLKLASVIGRSFFERVLRAISEAELDLDGSLTRLEHVQLIRTGQELPELEYVFKHALVQEATYNSILAESRRGIHLRIAQAIETLFADRLEEFTSLLAHHYACAENWEKAQQYLFKAGDQAGRMAGDTEALEHFRQAEAAYVKAFGDKLSPLERASLARKIAVALDSTGHYEEGLQQFRRALAQLGWSYPVTRFGTRVAILKYLGAHLLRVVRARLGIPVMRNLNLEWAREISTICHTMAWADYFLDKERMLLDCLLELQAGENSHYTVAEARGLSSLGFGFMTFDARAIGRRYQEKAGVIAERSGHPSAIGFSLHATGFLDLYTGRWDECDQNLRKAAAAYHEAGDIHRQGGALLVLSFITQARGNLAETCAIAEQLIGSGEDAADPQLVSWGFQVLGYAQIAAGPLDRAIASMRRGVALAEKLLAWDNFLYQSALLGKCLVMQGELQEADELLDNAVRVMAVEKLSRPFDKVELFTARATAKLAIAERMEGAARRAGIRAARRACKKALGCARLHPLWLPQAYRLCGTASWLMGKQDDAQSRWQKSISIAEASRFPIERGRTLLEMGRRTADPELIEQATNVFQETGANLFGAFSLHSLAEIRAGQSADDQSTIRDYSIAIDALEKVGAEHELARARRQLALVDGSGTSN